MVANPGAPMQYEWPADGEYSEKRPGKGLQDLLKKLRNLRISFRHPKKSRRKLTLRGRKKRYTTSKHTDTSSTDSSEYSTDSSVFSSSEDESWEQGVPITPSQEMNWTQFINKLCSNQPVDPQLSPNKE
uniref:ORF4 n=1 Tax=Rodent Torque teno virus 1 TaxID=1514664 RepID=X2GD20_9VIRU|nr:ORF4 [Rodent Torque teno virus 1]